MEPLEALLRIENLSVHFSTSRGTVRAVQDVGFSCGRGESLGIVGESGSGKSVTSLAIMGLLQKPAGKIVNGRIIFDNMDLTAMDERGMQHIRGNRISMVFQEPMTSLNPIHTCGKQIQEALLLHKGMTKKQAEQEALKAMKDVHISLPEKRLKEYPHQLSGGMRQRIMIAMAMSCKPDLLIADEPTTALDVTIQAQILDLISELKNTTGTGVMLITHDLAVVKEVCDRVVVMYLGEEIEQAPAADLFAEPLHPYTRGLIKSIPRITPEREPLYVIKHDVPNPFDIPPGCGFHPRCPEAMARCGKERPPFGRVNKDRSVRCWKYEGI